VVCGEAGWLGSSRSTWALYGQVGSAPRGAHRPFMGRLAACPERSDSRLGARPHATTGWKRAIHGHSSLGNLPRVFHNKTKSGVPASLSHHTTNPGTLAGQCPSPNNRLEHSRANPDTAPLRACRRIAWSISVCGAGVPPALSRAGETPAPQGFVQVIPEHTPKTDSDSR
jgi:hypothetical protein